MDDILYCKDLYDLVEGDSKKLEKISDEDRKKLSQKAVVTIY